MSALNDMFLYDAVICNTDRHFENFGFLVDNHTNEIVIRQSGDEEGTGYDIIVVPVCQFQNYTICLNCGSFTI